MTPVDKDWASQFARRSRTWSWPALFRQLDKSDLFIIDPDILRAIEDRFGNLKCQTESPLRALRKQDVDIKRVFVLCRRDEWALTKQLRGQYTANRVYSCTYDLAPKSLFEKPKLATPVSKKPVPVKRPLVLISTPYSDAEYLCDILRQNKFGNPREYLDRTLATWLEECSDFQVSRYFDRIIRLYQSDGMFDLHLQTDVLARLFGHSHLGWRRLEAWLKKTKAQVIYFTRRDKMAQTGFGSALDVSLHRSVFDISPAQRKAFKPLPGSFADANAWLQQLLQQEAELEDWLEHSIEDFRSVTLEEIVEQPVEVIRSLSIYLGKKTPKAIHIPDYKTPYREMPHLWEDAVRFRHEMIDRLGLHVNTSGSWVTNTDRLLKG